MISKDDAIRMGQTAGAGFALGAPGMEDFIVRLVQSAYARALEDCAQVCDDKAKKVNSAWMPTECADAIRALAGKESFNIVANPSIPAVEAHFVQDGKVVGVIKNIGPDGKEQNNG